MVNRYRKNRIEVPVTDAEKELILERVQRTGCRTISDYVRKIAINGYIFVVDYSYIKKMTYEINKVGININQIAHKVNETGQIDREEIKELKDLMEAIWQMQKQILSEEP